MRRIEKAVGRILMDHTEQHPAVMHLGVMWLLKGDWTIDEDGLLNGELGCNVSPYDMLRMVQLGK